MVKKYIILADSSIGFETPRQLSVICGEPIIKRTIRLLKENGIKDIIITSHDPRFDNLGAVRYEPKFNDYNPADPKSAWLKAFPVELMEEPTCYLFGDVYYSENAIKTIVEKDNKDILFFCTYNNKDKKYINNFCFIDFYNRISIFVNWPFTKVFHLIYLIISFYWLTFIFIF